MKLISFGCSHIYGSEMPDLAIRAITDGSNLTWPALLAKHLNLEYSTYAWPGRGNLFIAEQVLNQIAEPALFVINWTYIDRFDFKDSENSVPQSFPGSNWDTCRPGEDDQFNEVYYKYLHSEYADKITSLIQIKTCVDALIQHKRPFVMTYMDELIFDNRWNTSLAIKYLQDQLSPHMTTFENKNFVRYAEVQGFSTTDNDHLTAAGHEFCADYIISQLGVNKIKTA